MSISSTATRRVLLSEFEERAHPDHIRSWLVCLFGTQKGFERFCDLTLHSCQVLGRTEFYKRCRSFLEPVFESHVSFWPRFEEWCKSQSDEISVNFMSAPSIVEAIRKFGISDTPRDIVRFYKEAARLANCSREFKNEMGVDFFNWDRNDRWTVFLRWFDQEFFFFDPPERRVFSIEG